MKNKPTYEELEERVKQLEAAALASDTSERDHMERELRESEARLRLFIELAPAPIAMCDLKMHYIAYSRRWIKDYQLPDENLIGRSHYEVFQTIPDKWKKEHQRCFKGEVIDSEEALFPRSDGSIDWVRRKVHPWRDSDGQIGGLIMFTEVITRRKRIESALIESEAKYRTLVENATDAIFIAQDEAIKFPNRKALEILGYKDENREEIPFLTIIHPDDRQRVADIHRRRLMGEKGLPTSYSFKIINQQGREYVVELNAVRIDWEGRLATLNFVRDITEQKRLEQSLQQARKMDAIGTLAGGIAHDFNNILMGIQGHTSLMLFEEPLSATFREHLKGIETYVKSAADLTMQLLGFARGGKYEVIPINLNELVDQSAQLFGRTKKEIKIHKNLERNLWTVEADRHQIEQVLFNIYVNAWQAMPSGGQLYLSTTNTILDTAFVTPFQVDPGHFVKLSITDTGIGMDEATKQKIFEPFFTTKSMGHGTGLGLASTYGIIRNHKGIINVYSEKGKGSTFNVYLPANVKTTALDEQIRIELITGDETILLVDDEEMILDIGKRMLERLGYTVHAADCGLKAIELYRQHKERIHIVVLDMVMPDMNGAETFDRIREINPQAKVLLSSGYSINGQATEILNRGCNGFIQKPFNLLELSQKLREILKCVNKSGSTKR